MQPLIYPLRYNSIMITLRYRFILRPFHRCSHRCNGLQCVTRTYFAISINVKQLRLRRLLSSFVRSFVRSFSFKFCGLLSPIYCLLPSTRCRRKVSRRMSGDAVSAALRRVTGSVVGIGRGAIPNWRWPSRRRGHWKGPSYRSAATHDPFGRPLACKCGFHKPTPALDPPRRTHAPVLVTFSHWSKNS